MEKKEQSVNLSNIDQIISQLETNEVQKFEQTILQLSNYVNANCSINKNPLLHYFEAKIQHEQTVLIEILDTAIQKHLKNLSDETLVTLFKMTFKSVSYDSYNATLLVVREVIDRKNIETQKQIVNQFYKACEYYDPGHRFWEETVHDQLLDELFSQFTSEALYELLEKGLEENLLNSQYGDAMDVLFIPALLNTKDIKLQEKIAALFLTYKEENENYLEKEYFDELIQQINEVAYPEFKNLILQKKKEKSKDPWFILLDEIKEEDLPRIIDMLGNEIPKNIEEEYYNEIIKACTKTELLQSSITKLLIYLVKKGERSDLAAILFSQYHKNSSEKIIAFLKTQLEENFLNKEFIFDVVNYIKEIIVNNGQSLEEGKIYEDFVVSHCDKSYDNIYNTQIINLLNKYCNCYSENKEKEWIIDNVKTLINKVTDEVSYSNLSYKIDSLLHDGEYEKIKELFDVLYPKMKQTKEQEVLHCNIIASIKLKDEPYFDIIFNEIQQLERITKVKITFDLARAFVIFERKDLMLFYIKDSIRRRKIQQEFLDCPDFEKYLNDEEFLEALKETENQNQREILNLLEKVNEQNLPEIIEQLVNQKPEDFVEKVLSKIVDTSKKINLPETSLGILLDFIIKKDKKDYLSSLLLAKYHKNSSEKIIAFLIQELEKSQLEIIDVFNIIKKIIKELIALNVSFDELKIYEEFIVNRCNVNFNEIYNIEIWTLLSKFFNHVSSRSDQDISWTLEKIKVIAHKIDGEITYYDLRDDTFYLIKSGEYESVKQVFDVLYPKTIELKEESVLFYNIIAAIKLNDEPYFDLLYKEVQKTEKISEVLLAYNLACAFAHFGRKDELLFYIKESFRLGKTKQQFLDDTDFEKYWTDADFLVAIEDK